MPGTIPRVISPRRGLSAAGPGNGGELGGELAVREGEAGQADALVPNVEDRVERLLVQQRGGDFRADILRVDDARIQTLPIHLFRHRLGQRRDVHGPDLDLLHEEVEPAVLSQLRTQLDGYDKPRPFDSYDPFLLTPGAQQFPGDGVDAKILLNDGQVWPAAGWQYVPNATVTVPFDITGQPAISLPLSWNRDGLPIGVQLVAAYGREDVLLRVAAQLETAQPWADRRPPVHA